MRENHNIPPKEPEAASTAEVIPEGVSLSDMSKPPAFQFYANDFMGSTITWDAIACGMYIRLLCTQWVNGSIPDDQRRIARAAGVELVELQREWHLLEPKFPLTKDGVRKNARLEAVRDRQAEISDLRRKASEVRWSDSNASSNAYANDNAKHKQRKVKEKIEGEIQGREPAREIVWPSWAGEKTRSAWEDFKAYRKTEKKDPIRSVQSEQRAVNLLAKYYTTGQECVEALEECMGRGWLFPVNPAKLNSRSSPPSQPPPSPTAKPWIG